MFTDKQLEEIEQMGISICKNTFKVNYFSPNKFASYIKGKSHLIYNKGEFYTYNNGKWSKVDELRVFKRLRAQLHKYFDDIWSTKVEREYVEALKRIVLHNEELNSYKDYINMLNGMYDLETHTLVEHSLKFYSTIQIPINYDENAECPNFMKFLDECFLGDEDSKILSQEWAGYSMTAEVKAQKALVLYGTGANGKGVFIDLISYCIGSENISSVALNELNKPFMRVCLHNKLANICSENENNGASLNTQYFKMITGEDVITAEQKYKPAFSFKPTAKIIMAMNNLPHTKDTSHGFQRRLSVLHFRNTVAENKRDRNLKDKLKQELQGIFNWSILGLKRLKENEFRFSDCNVSNEVIKNYAKDINPFICFFEECIEKAEESYKEDKKVIYNTFKVWADANGMKGYADISTRKFWAKFDEQLKVLGYMGKSGHSNKLNYHTGVRVIGEFKIDINNPIYKY
ncbi:phage/plasmid primase, P4 family [Clostridium sp. CF012]|uniref:DNA primase family protein n=1 Tax=Clostridium sp. CF012 TaxID=2843319 RepID=UPI001C0C1CFD|nr:DNA primase family protein [Clostridium sp. CF012]MBU3144612.1 hypothetical protein [Clostridium sp. CF012]